MDLRIHRPIMTANDGVRGYADSAIFKLVQRFERDSLFGFCFPNLFKVSESLAKQFALEKGK